MLLVFGRVRIELADGRIIERGLGNRLGIVGIEMGVGVAHLGVRHGRHRRAVTEQCDKQRVVDSEGGQLIVRHHDETGQRFMRGLG